MVQIPGQAHISELTALVKTPLTRMQYAPDDECGAYATQHWKPRAEPPFGIPMSEKLSSKFRVHK